MGERNQYAPWVIFEMVLTVPEKSYYKPHKWALAHGRTLELGASSIIMGILNVTPDSFSDGGLNIEPDKAAITAKEMIKAGATIIDIGGESTKPGAIAIDGKTELQRVLPVIHALVGHPDIMLSIDTYRASTARAAIEAGCHIVNDVWGLQKDPEMADVVASTKAGVVIMHTGRERQVLDDVIEDQRLFLRKSLQLAQNSDIAENSIVLDPGIGFAKAADDCLELLNRFEELHEFGFPLLIGASRKRFLGTITGHENFTDRDIATAATSIVARMKGAAIFRVHDVAANLDALKVADAILAANTYNTKGKQS
jgi:dihydropteroate synthase